MPGIVSTRFDTSTNRDLLKEGALRDLFDTTSHEVTLFYKPLVNDLTSDEYSFRDQEIGGLTKAQEVVEGQNAPMQTPVLGANKTYTMRFFATGFRMTFAMDRFNRYGLWQKWAKALARMQKECKDYEIHLMFNNPTSTALTCGTGFDTLAIASDAHTGLASGTSDNYDNKLLSDLSSSALASARYYFKTLKDAMGNLRSVDPTLLVYEPTQHITAKEIFGSDLRAHELSNTSNVIPGALGVKLYEDPRLSSTTMWFMLAKDSDLFQINVFTNMEPDLIMKDAPDFTRDRVAMTVQIFTYGWSDPRCFYLGQT